LNKHWAKKEIKKELKRFLETNEKGVIIYQNIWDTGKTIL
jgi:hypothetical protein